MINLWEQENYLIATEPNSRENQEKRGEIDELTGKRFPNDFYWTDD